MLASALVCLALAAPPAAPGPEEALQRAEKLFSADKFGEAEPLYQAALKSNLAFVKRQAYERLMGLYVRSGRQDKAIQLAGPFRAWLADLGDAAAPGELELLLGECYLGLGYLDKADEHLTAALAAVPRLADERRLQALRCRAETAVQRRSPDVAKRWDDLQAAARQVAATANKAEDTAMRVAAVRFLAEGLQRRGEADQALAALAALPELIDRLKDPMARRDVQRQRANLLASRGRYAEAVPLYREALAVHRKYRGDKRMTAGDILAEWATSAAAAGTPAAKAEAAALRDEAAVEYRAVLDAPTYDDPDGGSPIAAFAKLQILTRSARQFRKALDLSKDAAERWSGDGLINARLQSDRGGLELLTSSYQAARKLLTQALAELDAAQPPDLRSLPLVLVNLATAELACDSRDRTDALLDRCEALYRDQRLPDDPVLAECEYLKGVSASQRGDFARAMKAFRRGLAVCEAAGKEAESVRFNLWLNTALIHKDQGDATAALDSLKQASAALAGFADADDLSFALIDAVRADLFISQSRFAPALALVPKIEAACERNGVKGGYLWTTARHVRALEKLVAHDLKTAEGIWSDLAALQKKEGQLLLARTLNFLGVAAELQGRDADAVRRFEEAREFQATRPRCGPITKAITFWRLGALMDKLGRRDEAKALMTQVFDVADKARLNTFGEAAQRAQFFAQFAPAFDLLAKWSARDADGDGLLRVASRSRSRTLLDQILAAGVDPRANLTGPNRERLLRREAAAREAVSHCAGPRPDALPGQAGRPGREAGAGRHRRRPEGVRRRLEGDHQRGPADARAHRPGVRGQVAGEAAAGRGRREGAAAVLRDRPGRELRRAGRRPGGQAGDLPADVPAGVGGAGGRRAVGRGDGPGRPAGRGRAREAPAAGAARGRRRPLGPAHRGRRRQAGGPLPAPDRRPGVQRHPRHRAGVQEPGQGGAGGPRRDARRRRPAARPAGAHPPVRRQAADRGARRGAAQDAAGGPAAVVELVRAALRPGGAAGDLLRAVAGGAGGHHGPAAAPGRAADAVDGGRPDVRRVRVAGRARAGGGDAGRVLRHAAAAAVHAGGEQADPRRTSRRSGRPRWWAGRRRSGT